MATAAVQTPSSSHGAAFQTAPTASLDTSSKKTGAHDVHTTLNYYKEPADGSPPAPTYVGKPETYNNRPVETVDVSVTDISGNVDDYTLDGNGFQIYQHVSGEKEFVDDEKIKREYYPETEQLLKDA